MFDGDPESEPNMSNLWVPKSGGVHAALGRVSVVKRGMRVTAVVEIEMADQTGSGMTAVRNLYVPIANKPAST